MKFKVIKNINEGLWDVQPPVDPDCRYEDLTDLEKKEVDEAVYEEISNQELAEEIKQCYKGLDFEEYDCNEDIELLEKTFPYAKSIDEVPIEEIIKVSDDPEFKRNIISEIDYYSEIFTAKKDELANEIFGDKYREIDDDLIDSSIPSEYVHGAKDFYDPYSYKG